MIFIVMVEVQVKMYGQYGRLTCITYTQGNQLATQWLRIDNKLTCLNKNNKRS